jgi:hypothetical protein
MKLYFGQISLHGGEPAKKAGKAYFGDSLEGCWIK